MFVSDTLQQGGMVNGSAGPSTGFPGLDMTSADMERRDLQEGPGLTAQPPTTAPLEVKEMPPALAKTLENFVGQLDVLTQVRIGVGSQGMAGGCHGHGRQCTETEPSPMFSLKNSTQTAPLSCLRSRDTRAQ